MDFTESDKNVLKKLRVFAIITLIVSIITIVLVVWELLSFPKLFSWSGMWISVKIQNMQVIHLYTSVILLESVVVKALTVVGIIPLRSALGDLSRAGGHNFRAPRIMLLVMLACVLVNIAGRVFEPQINSPLPHWVDLIFLFILLTGAYGAIVGGIGGEMLGVWMMGSRYRENLFKAASIPLIVPVVQVISPILIFIGLRKISRNLVHLAIGQSASTTFNAH